MSMMMKLRQKDINEYMPAYNLYSHSTKFENLSEDDQTNFSDPLK